MFPSNDNKKNIWFLQSIKILTMNLRHTIAFVMCPIL